MRKGVVRAAMIGGLLATGCSGGEPNRPVDAGPDGGADRPVDLAINPDSLISPDRPPDTGVDMPSADAAADVVADLAPDSQRGDLPLPANFVLTPESHDFMAVPVGMSRTRIFELKNTGGQNSGTPSISLMGGSEGVFEIIDNLCETSLESEETCMIEVQFSPDAAGPAGVLLEAAASPGGKVSSQLNGTGQ